MLDFHNHLIPGVDDGAATISESRAALKMMSDQGFRTIITTPHLSASSVTRGNTSEYLAKVDRGWEELLALTTADFPGLRIARGVELLLDVPMFEIVDQRLRLAGSQFVLVEFPWTGIPLNSAKTLFELKMNGYTPVIAHPERYAAMDVQLRAAEEWVQSGAVLQVNAGSFLGQYGGRAQSLAWSIIGHGLASYICSDYHARGKCATRSALRLLTQVGASEIALLLSDVNPNRLIENLLPVETPPFRRKHRRWWEKLLRRRY